MAVPGLRIQRSKKKRNFEKRRRREIERERERKAREERATEKRRKKEAGADELLAEAATSGLNTTESALETPAELRLGTAEEPVLRVANSRLKTIESALESTELELAAVEPDLDVAEEQAQETVLETSGELGLNLPEEPVLDLANLESNTIEPGTGTAEELTSEMANLTNGSVLDITGEAGLESADSSAETSANPGFDPVEVPILGTNSRENESVAVIACTSEPSNERVGLDITGCAEEENTKEASREGLTTINTACTTTTANTAFPTPPPSAVTRDPEFTNTRKRKRTSDEIPEPSDKKMSFQVVIETPRKTPVPISEREIHATRSATKIARQKESYEPPASTMVLQSEKVGIDDCALPPKKRRKSAWFSAAVSPHFPTPAPSDTTETKGTRKMVLTSSPHFSDTTEKKARTPKGLSVIPWPLFSEERFGLVQEELQENPFHLLIAAIFLNRTKGSVAKPLLSQFFILYPTPEALSAAPQREIEDFMQPLGLFRIRAERMIKMAQVWQLSPPSCGSGGGDDSGTEAVMYNYPPKDTRPFPIPGREPCGVVQKLKWEIAHLPGVGAYALDSWRIFCRDRLRAGLGTEGDLKEAEWKRVVPKDKELRAYCRWRWAKEGVTWEEEEEEDIILRGGENQR